MLSENNMNQPKLSLLARLTKLQPSSIKPVLALSLITVICATFFISPVASYLDFNQSTSATLVASIIVLFATSVIPEPITALLLMVLAMLLSIAPADVVFSGFASTACWLIFSGLVIGIAITETGLAARMASVFSHKLDSGYLQLVTGIVVIGILLGFVMPSSVGRVVVLMPIVVAIACNCGFDDNSNGRIGLVLAAAFGCHIPTFAILPANIPNMVMIGTAETIHQWTPKYAEYLLLHFPVLGALKSVLLIALILWLYPDQPKASNQQKSSERVSRNEYMLIAVMSVTLLMWVTDSIHHISSAWVGLAAATLLLMPKIGLVSQDSFSRKVNVNSLLVVSGLLALGAIINHTGLGALLADQLVDKLPLQQGDDLQNFIALSMTALFVGISGTLASVPALLTPMAEQLSANTGFSLEAVLMTQVFGFSTVVLPYQSVPLLMALPLGGVAIGHAAKLCLYLAAATILLLLPLNYLWWQLLGWI
ncbi:SLC13 family permease [Oceanospirillum beijerinckii]|uniref:SLC13 family permease n=1 Tax=Oceanospirillum beijerinckii TaxID=64976 RepID=UPI0004022D1E|nr:SLC13 family permease [Oceanospirillum beijerinckii]